MRLRSPRSTLDATHVSTVRAQDLGEGFLAQTAGVAPGAQVRAHRPLEFPLSHVAQRERMLLESLQTYE